MPMRSALAIAGLMVLLAGCEEPGPSAADIAAARAATARSFAAFLERAQAERFDLDPEARLLLTGVGGNPVWTDRSQAAIDARYVLAQRQHAELFASIDYVQLSALDRLDYDLFVDASIRRSDAWRWRHHENVLTGPAGVLVRVPEVLDDLPLRNDREAEAYVAALDRLPTLVAQVRERLTAAAAAGVHPPEVVRVDAVTRVRTLLRDEAMLGARFRSAIDTLDVPPARRHELLDRARRSSRGPVATAWRSLLADIDAKPDRRTAGARSLADAPNGVQYYRALVRWNIGPELTPERLHERGLAEVASLEETLAARRTTARGMRATLPSEGGRARLEPMASGRPMLAVERAGAGGRREEVPPAFVEGWSLYAARAAAMDSEDARAAQTLAELTSAAKLVVDTGIHVHHWSLDRARRYLREHAALPSVRVDALLLDVLAAPSLASVPSAGLWRIADLRGLAEQELGEAFELRAFHEAVLRHGPVPLHIVEREVDAYITGRAAASPPSR